MQEFNAADLADLGSSGLAGAGVVALVGAERTLAGLSASTARPRHVAIVSERVSEVVCAEVYDLEVEEDHSMVVEGFIAHNCPLCMSRDGHLYDPATKQPLDPATKEKVPVQQRVANPGAWPPWGAGPGHIHMRCRCVEQIVTKSLRELGIDIDEVAVEGRRAATTPEGLVNGDVPDSVTFAEWLRTQPRRVVEDILGEARAELFLSGRLTFSQLFEASGDFLPLEDLRDRFAAILAAS
jgi:hypothetical protein